MAASFRDFAKKLQFVSDRLGCRTTKDLCAAFQDADPDSVFQPAQVARWLQGTATPRDLRAAAEIARVLGLDEPPERIAESTAEELAAAALRRPEPAAADADHDHLAADYLTYAPAWSPYFEGHLMRGRLALSPAGEGRIAATYTEVILGRPAAWTGEGMPAGRVLHLGLSEPARGRHLAMTFCVPHAPGSLLCGVVSGITSMGKDHAPAASRVLAIRLPDSRRALPEGYAPNGADTVLDDLRGLGLMAEPPLAEAACAFLLGAGGGADAVAWGEAGELTRLADMLHAP